MELVKVIEINRSSKCSLMDMCIEKILSNKIAYCVLAKQIGENPMKKLCKDLYKKTQQFDVTSSLKLHNVKLNFILQLLIFEMSCCEKCCEAKNSVEDATFGH